MPAFLCATFVGAFLLFFVQPLMARFTLPWFGGGASIWAGCMLFFQTALLAGYAYANWLGQRFSPRRQALIHLTLIGVAVLFLLGQTLLHGAPVSLWPGLRPVAGQALAPRLLLLLALTIGIPFVGLAATAPLLQRWFAFRYPAQSPYRLYALSNAGSLLSLFCYPILVEPYSSRTAQGWAFAGGLTFYGLLCVACARHLPAAAPASPTPETPTPLSVRQGAVWVGLSALGTLVLLGATRQLEQDFGSSPVLWLLPLGIYLLTFILAFEREAFYRRWVFFAALAALIPPMVPLVENPVEYGLWRYLLGMLGPVFLCCMVCHGELYRLRPPPTALGTFYMALSLGGALGSLLSYGLAPLVFRTFPDFVLAVAVTGVLAAALVLKEHPSGRGRALAVGLAVVCALPLTQHLLLQVTFADRSFFGVVTVEERNPEAPDYHRYLFRHGRIVHGDQLVRHPDRPTGYFVPESGLGLILQTLRQQKPGGLRVGMLGVGIGGSLALMEAGDQVRGYEIDPAVIRLARGEGGYFSYLARTRAQVELVEGDARFSLETELAQGRPGKFDLLVMDCFAGDSAPTHLLTREAADLYQAHLAEGGAVALHISNLYLNLIPVVAPLAQRLGLSLARIHVSPQPPGSPTTWAILAPDAVLRSPPLSEAPTLRRLALEDEEPLVWTDERSSLWPLLRTL